MTYETLEKGIDKNDQLYVQYEINEIDTGKRYIKRVMDSETFKDLIEEKDELLENAKNCSKVQLMCFSEDGAERNNENNSDSE